MVGTAKEVTRNQDQELRDLQASRGVSEGELRQLAREVTGHDLATLYELTALETLELIRLLKAFGTEPHVNA
jgi:hypothetical protein